MHIILYIADMHDIYCDCQQKLLGECSKKQDQPRRNYVAFYYEENRGTQIHI